MTPDLAVRPVSTADPPRAPARAAGPERDAGAAPPVASPATPNPRLRLDGSLGMVVIEFRDSVGDVANTIPSPRQIAAYRAAVVSDAPVPVGVVARQAPGVTAAVAPELPAPQAPVPRAPVAQAPAAAQPEPATA